MDSPHRVAIVGGGFGGLLAAQGLAGAPVAVTLIDRRNFHVFQPLLYQVATGGLSPANIAAPLRSVLRHQQNTQVLLGEVVDFDLVSRRVLMSDGEVPFDTLLLATGARHHYFGKDAEWEPFAPGLKTIEDAIEIRARILRAFERAERVHAEAHEWLTFVIVGGGPTGVELAGALGELAHHTLRGEFRTSDPGGARIMLLEAGPRILSAFSPQLSERAREGLERLSVEVRTGVAVSQIGPGYVTLRTGGLEEVIRSRTVLWAAGVRGSPLGQKLAQAAGAELDGAGRVKVAPDCSVPGWPDVFVIGDLASMADVSNKPLPGIAPVAMQQGRYVAGVIRDRLAGRPTCPFRYSDRGSMATVGRSYAIVDFGRLRIWGFPGWITWLFVHLLFLVQFQNRVLVLIQWAWNYVTRNRAARLITGSR